MIQHNNKDGREWVQIAPLPAVERKLERLQGHIPDPAQHQKWEEMGCPSSGGRAELARRLWSNDWDDCRGISPIQRNTNLEEG